MTIQALFSGQANTRNDWKEDWKESSKVDWRVDWTTAPLGDTWTAGDTLFSFISETYTPTGDFQF